MIKPKALAALSVGLCLFAVNSESKSADGLKTVKAGETMTFEVTLSQSPPDGGQLQVLVGPFFESWPDNDQHPWCKDNLCRGAYVPTIASRTSYEVCIQIPGDVTQEGLWEAFVGFALPNGDFRELAHGEMKFWVKPNPTFDQYKHLRVNEFHIE